MRTIKHHIRLACATMVMVTAFAAAIFAPTVTHVTVASTHASQIQQAGCGGLNVPECGVTAPRI